MNNERQEEAVTYTTNDCCIRRHKIGNISVQSEKILIKSNAFHWQIVIFKNV